MLTSLFIGMTQLEMQLLEQYLLSYDKVLETGICPQKNAEQQGIHIVFFLILICHKLLNWILM